MYSIHNRDDLEKLKKLQETKSLLRKERIKEKLGKQDFHYDMEEVFEPITTKQAEVAQAATENQKQLSEKQIQALHDSSLAIENQTRAIQESSNTLHDNLQKSIKEGIQDYDEITNRTNQLLTSLVNSNQVDSGIVRTVSNLLNTKSQFSLEPITQNNPNLFTINPHNPQQVLIKGSTMTFENGHSYDLNDQDLQNFITNTQFDREINNVNIIFNFLNDMNYNTNYGDKKSNRYNFIKNLYNQYYQQSYQQPQTLNNQLGSGLRSCANQYVFLPSDPDELVDQLKLLYFEKVGGNDDPQLNEQIIAIVDKLLKFECITPSQHQNMRSMQNTFYSTTSAPFEEVQFVD